MISIKLSENEGRAPEAVPYMPPGEHSITATVNGRPGRRDVVVDRAACERLQADLEEKLRAAKAGECARPVLLYDHKAGEAAAVPVGFEWDEQRGILLRVEWTQAGRNSVEGGSYAYVSPAFRLGRGGQILGLSRGVEVGSLVNDPAFERNECIAASREIDEECCEVLYSSNPTGCNQYGHGWRGDCPKGGAKARQGEEKEEYDDDKEIDEYEKLGKDEQWQKLQSWRKVVQQATEKALDIRESARYRQGDKDAKKEYEAQKEQANAEAKKLRDRIRKIWEKRGKTGKAVDRMLDKTYPETVLSQNADLPPRSAVENSIDIAHNRCACEGTGETKKQKTMDSIKKKLGLPPDATDEDVMDAIARMQEQSQSTKKQMEEIEAECEQHRHALKKHKEATADAFVKRLTKSGKVAPKDEKRIQAARSLYMENAEQAEIIFAAMPGNGVLVGETITASVAPDSQHRTLADEMQAEFEARFQH